MSSIRQQRIIAAALAISGTIYAAFVWVFAPLWIGYVVWIGWIAVALGQKRWQEKWFWIFSGGWNLLLLILLLSDADWMRPKNQFGYWHGLGHLAFAVLLSAYLVVKVPWDTWPENRRAQ